MTQLVGQNGLYLIGTVLGIQSISQHDAPCIAQAHHHGVGSPGLAAQIDGEHPPHLRIGPFSQSRQPSD